MFELPEIATLVAQMNETLIAKRISKGQLGNSPHKFVWYNRSHEEFEKLTRGRTTGYATAKGRFLFLPLEPDYVLVVGECGGKILYHAPGTEPPRRYHLLLSFDDDSSLSAITQMWGAFELYEKGKENSGKYVAGMKITPVEPGFTFDYFCNLIDETMSDGKPRSVKALLTQEQLIPGLGNAIAQDIMFRARLHPRHPISGLAGDERRVLYDTVIETVQQVISKGGRHDEYDLHGNNGGYVRIMAKDALNRPCPNCGGGIKKIQYLGGACYLCPRCQT